MKFNKLLAVGMSSLIAVSIAHADLSSTDDATNDSISPMQPSAPNQLADNNVSGNANVGGMSGGSSMGGMSGASAGVSGSSNMSGMSGSPSMGGMSGTSGGMSGASSTTDEGSLDTATGDDY